jgi:hypothetical protein
MSNLDMMTVEESVDTLDEFLDDFMGAIRDTQEQVHQCVFDDFRGYKLAIAVSLVSIEPLNGVMSR